MTVGKLGCALRWPHEIGHTFKIFAEPVKLHTLQCRMHGQATAQYNTLPVSPHHNL